MSEITALTIRDIFNVCRMADESKVLSTSIPKDFFEQDATNILESFKSFNKNNHDDTYKRTNIIDKFNNNEYTSVYQLFHDLKVSSVISIQSHKIGSVPYNNIDFFYKFATELILREASRLGIKNVEGEVKTEDDTSELESQLSEDFTKISSTYSSENGQVIYVVHKIDDPNHIPTPDYLNHQQQEQEKPPQKNQPLFTSLIGKSSLDARPTIVPEPFQLLEIIPNSRMPYRESSTLNTLSPAGTLKIPAPTMQPTEMMNNFFHPNWYTLAIPSWLQYQSIGNKAIESIPSTLGGKTKNSVSYEQVKRIDSYAQSFSPIVDLRSTIVSEYHKSNIWLQHIGYKEIGNIKRRYLQGDEDADLAMDIDDDDIDEDELEDAEDTPAATNGEKEQQQSTVAENGAESEKEDEEKEIGKVDIKNLIDWDPSKINLLDSLKRDKASILTTKGFQNLISKNILTLNKLRQQRYSNRVGNNPSSVEVHLYKKTIKLITLFIQHHKVSPSDLSIQFSKRLPVLLNDYSGTLPGSIVNTKTSTLASKNNRLPSVRGPYKKKGR